MGVFLLAIYILLALALTLTAASSAVVYLRLRHTTQLKYFTYLALLSTASDVVLATLFVLLSIARASTTADSASVANNMLVFSVVTLSLAFVSIVLPLVGWTSVALYLFGIFNGVHQ